MYFFNNVSGIGVVIYTGSVVKFCEVAETNEYRISVNKRTYKVTQNVYNDVKTRFGE